MRGFAAGSVTARRQLVSHRRGHDGMSLLDAAAITPEQRLRAAPA
jgi:hypothetical protein